MRPGEEECKPQVELFLSPHHHFRVVLSREQHPPKQGGSRFYGDSHRAIANVRRYALGPHATTSPSGANRLEVALPEPTVTTSEADATAPRNPKNDEASRWRNMRRR